MTNKPRSVDDLTAMVVMHQILIQDLYAYVLAYQPNSVVKLESTKGRVLHTMNKLDKQFATENAESFFQGVQKLLDVVATT